MRSVEETVGRGEHLRQFASPYRRRFEFAKKLKSAKRYEKKMKIKTSRTVGRKKLKSLEKHKKRTKSLGNSMPCTAKKQHK